MADCVSYVAWSRDDKWLLSGGNDLVVKLWDAGSGLHLRDFVHHTEPVTAIAWSPSPSLPLPLPLPLRSATPSLAFKSVYLYQDPKPDPKNPSPHLTLNPGPRLTLDPSPRRPLPRGCGAGPKRARYLLTSAAQALPHVRPPSCARTDVPHVRRLCRLDSEGRFVTGSYDKQLITWHMERCQPQCVMEGLRVTDLAVSQDGSRLVLVTPDKKIKMYSLPSMCHIPGTIPQVLGCLLLSKSTLA